MSLWVVGQYKAETEHGAVWEFVGVFDDRALAVEACRDNTYFIAPAVLNDVGPHETQEWPGTEYPIESDAVHASRPGD